MTIVVLADIGDGECDARQHEVVGLVDELPKPPPVDDGSVIPPIGNQLEQHREPDQEQHAEPELRHRVGDHRERRQAVVRAEPASTRR